MHGEGNGEDMMKEHTIAISDDNTTRWPFVVGDPKKRYKVAVGFDGVLDLAIEATDEDTAAENALALMDLWEHPNANSTVVHAWINRVTQVEEE